MTDTITDKRERGYFQVDNEVVENYQLSPYSGWLYCVISKYASRTGEAFPSITTLAKEANMSKPAVIKHMAILEQRNLIKVKRAKINAKKNAVNHYFFQPIIKNSYLELLKVVNEVAQGGKRGLLGVVNEVDRNKTQSNKTQEEEKKKTPGVAGEGDSSQCEKCHELYIEVRSVDGAKHLTCLCDDSTMQKNDNAPLATENDLSPTMREIIEDMKDVAARTGKPFRTFPNHTIPDGRKVGNKPDIDPKITAAIPPQNIKRTPRMVLPSEEEINALGESTANIKAKTVEVAQIVSPPAPETAQEKRDKEIDAIEADMKRVGNPQETFGAICGVLGWDTDTVPKKKKSRVGKAARELMEVNASIWKLERMQRWAKSKYGDKWNFGFNLGSPEKVVEFWATYCGETKDQNIILTPADPTIPLHFVEPSPLPPEDRVSPEEIAKTMAAMVQLTRRKSTSYDPLTDTTAEEREAQNE